MRRGNFNVLFSAGCPLGTREPGVDVPEDFEPLVVGSLIHGQPRLPGCLRTENIRKAGEDPSASVSAPP